MNTYVHGNEAMQRPPEKRKPLDVSKGFRMGRAGIEPATR
jgi:hypothetical protein